MDAGQAHAGRLETLDAAQKKAHQWQGRVTLLIKVALADQPELST